MQIRNLGRSQTRSCYELKSQILLCKKPERDTATSTEVGKTQDCKLVQLFGRKIRAQSARKVEELFKLFGLWIVSFDDDPSFLLLRKCFYIHRS